MKAQQVGFSVIKPIIYSLKIESKIEFGTKMTIRTVGRLLRLFNTVMI